jgi:hypothetical protein
LIGSQTDGPAYDAASAGAAGEIKNVPLLEVVTSLNEDGRQLYIIAINKDFDNAIQASIALQGFAPAASATVWTLDGSGIDANTGTIPVQLPGLNWGRQTEDPRNPRFHRGGPGEVTLSESTIPGVSEQFRYVFPPHSITSLRLARR